MIFADLSSAGVNFVVMMLTAVAVLAWPEAWPRGRSVAVVVRGQSAPPDGQGRSGAAAGGPEADPGQATDADAGAGAGFVRRVPVAEVAGVLDLRALTRRSGAGLVESMEAVATRVGGPLGLHLRTVAAASRWGVDDAAAWASVPSAWQPAARALRMAASAGVPPADALARAADEVRRSEQQRVEVATATLGVRIVLPLGLVFLPAFILTTVVPIVLALAQQVLSSR